MSHSVQGHLRLRASEYDDLIRKFVPAYSVMRSVQLDLLALSIPPKDGLVLDLGGGTGSLAAAVADRFRSTTVEIWDIDPEMLKIARERCAHFGERIRCIDGSFTGPLPLCDAVAACLSLHHIKALDAKGATYRHIFQVLRPGGIFVNADTAVPSLPGLRQRAFQCWADSMCRHGISKDEAHQHFADWAGEDFYPPLATELRLLAEAGFSEPECFWRDGAAVVFGAMKQP
jgi:tRNA (cmo5U34)-methyltransferase